MREDDIRLDNMSMAIGRIGVAIMMVPLLLGMAALLIVAVEPGRAIGFGVFLFVIGMLLGWTATQVPISVAVKGDRVFVRFPLGVRTFAVGDIDRVESGTMRSTIGPGSRRYPCVTIILVNGRAIRIQGDSDAAELLRSRTTPAAKQSGGKPIDTRDG